jgi:flagellar motor switch protein FliN/FliY
MSQDAPENAAPETPAAAAPPDEPAAQAQPQESAAATDAGADNEPGPIAERAPTAPFAAPEFEPTEAGDAVAGLDLLDDVELRVTVELGRTEMYIEDVLRLGAGSVVELDKLAGDPVDVYVNGRLVARGEVLVLNDNFCVRVNDIVSPVPELDAPK